MLGIKHIELNDNINIANPCSQWQFVIAISLENIERLESSRFVSNKSIFLAIYLTFIDKKEISFVDICMYISSSQQSRYNRY